MRIQTVESGGWIVYAYLARAASDRDRIWLEWSDVYKPDEDQSHRCDGRAVNLIQQTPGIRARGPQGEPRWFRACGSVPVEFQWPGRGLTACTNWNRPDDY
ncbi:hypothetical protein [Nocardia inohanensis]|uniref:hypothetical protein n=1 Tax=Nocardia inohanensis TaxID=209246 RepID=UPI0012FADFD9|nr:hypothetical protein [Nocardia inohanensis]